MADGGGKVAAARRPVIGAEPVGRLMINLWHKVSIAPGGQDLESGEAAEGAGGAKRIEVDVWDTHLTSINGEMALVAYEGARLDSVFVFSTDGQRITAIRAVRNPDKLAWLATHTNLDPLE